MTREEVPLYSVHAPMTSTATSSLLAAHHSQASQLNRCEYAVVYTKHKTQKHKVWHDGRLVVHGGTGSLHQADPPLGSGDPVIDQVDLQLRGAALADVRIESDSFLIEVQGVWTPQRSPPAPTRPLSKQPSQAMQKLLKRKFRKPPMRGPPAAAATLPKIRRVLQPGELHRRYHGNGNAHHSSTAPASFHPPMPNPHPSWMQPTERQQSNLPSNYMRQPPVPTNQNSPPPNPAPRCMQSTEQQQSNLPSNYMRQPPVPTKQNSPPPPNPAPQFNHTPQSSLTRQVQQKPSDAVNQSGLNSNRAPIVHTYCLPPAPTSGNETNIKQNEGLQTRKSLAPIVQCNGFDPSCFFGEEEDDDDEGGEHSGDGFTNPGKQDTLVFGQNVKNPVPPVQDDPVAQDNDNGMSNSELLDLFSLASPHRNDSGTALAATSLPSQKSTGRAISPKRRSGNHQTNADGFCLPSDDDSSSDEE